MSDKSTSPFVGGHYTHNRSSSIEEIDDEIEEINTQEVSPSPVPYNPNDMTTEEREDDLLRCIIYGDALIMQRKIIAGADVSFGNDDLLKTAAAADDDGMVEVLLNSGQCDPRNFLPCIESALRNNSVDVAMLLVKKGTETLPKFAFKVLEHAQHAERPQIGAAIIEFICDAKLDASRETVEIKEMVREEMESRRGAQREEAKQRKLEEKRPAREACFSALRRAQNKADELFLAAVYEGDVDTARMFMQSPDYDERKALKRAKELAIEKGGKEMLRVLVL